MKLWFGLALLGCGVTHGAQEEGGRLSVKPSSGAVPQEEKYQLQQPTDYFGQTDDVTFFSPQPTPESNPKGTARGAGPSGFELSP